MSYLIIVLLFSFIVGIVVMFLFVMFNVLVDNVYNVVWGLIVFWVIVVVMVFFMIGWLLVVVSIVGGVLMLIGGGNIGVVIFIWGSVLMSFVNSVLVGLLFKFFCFIGV